MAGPGWPGCHVIVTLILINKRAEIPVVSFAAVFRVTSQKTAAKETKIPAN